MSGPTARKRGRRGSPESWSVDSHVGQRVRMRRTLLGMSQEKLGEAIGLTFQQVQKYERGSNRISAGTLYRLGQVLGVPVNFFFDNYNDPDGTRHASNPDDGSSLSDSQISRREARLLRLWRAAPPHVSDELLALLSSLSPNLREAQDNPDDGFDEEEEDGPAAEPGPNEPKANGPKAGEPKNGESGSKPSSPAQAPDTPPRTPARHSRADIQRVKTVTDESGGAKPRRRHGAVWDPTDIVRAAKTSPRE